MVVGRRRLLVQPDDVVLKPHGHPAIINLLVAQRGQRSEAPAQQHTEGALPNGYEIARLYKENRTSDQPKPTQASSFAVQNNEPTLPGESALKDTTPRDNTLKDKHCLIEGHRHERDACFIFNPALRPEGWVVRPLNARRVLAILGKKPST